MMKLRILIICALMLSILAVFAMAQVNSGVSEKEYEREIIVMFKTGVVELPEGKTNGSPGEVNFSSGSLRQILNTPDIQDLRKIKPDFEPEDRFVTNRTGDNIELERQN